MARKVISVPQILINDAVYRIVPNSFVYDGGELEINVRSASSGGGNIESVHSENAEGALSSCMFDVYLDNDLDGDIVTWKQNIGSNTIKVVERNATGDSFTRTFPGMSLTTRISRNASADGVTSLEWMGDQMVVG